MSEKPSKGGSLGGSIFLGLFGSFFAGMGIFAIVSTARGQLSGDDPEWAGYLMGGLFTLIGLGIIYAGIASLRHGKKAIEHPDEPWLLKKDWAEGRISDSNRIGFFFMAGFALIWNAISWTATIGVYQEGSDAEPVAYWVVLLFPLVGLGLIGVTIYQFLRWRKYGQSVFEMAEVPGVIGGSLGGLVLTSTDVKPAKGFQVTLVNQKEVTSGSGKNRSTHTTTIWESEQWIHEDALPDDHQRTALPIFFAIPYSCEPTADLGRTDYKWELRVKAEMPGVDYEARFSVPVYKTKDSDPSFDARAARAVSNNEAAPPPAIDWSKGGVSISDDLSGATVIQTTAGRHWTMLTVPLLIGVGMMVGAYFSWNSDMPKIFPFVFAGFGALITFGLAGALFGSLRLSVFPDRIESESRLILHRTSKSIQKAQIDHLELTSNMSAGETQFYDLVAHLNDGSKVRLPLKARGRSRAEALRRIVEEKLGLTVTPTE